MRDRTNHAVSTRSKHRLRIVQGTVRRDEFEDWTGEELLGRRAIALWQSCQRSHLSLSESLADGDIAARPGRPLLWIAVSSSHARQRCNVGKDFTRSYGASQLLSGRQRRAD